MDKFYLRRLWGSFMIVGGSFLLLEHVYQWGFQYWDFIGHEYLGIILIIAGSILAIRFKT